MLKNIRVILVGVIVLSVTIGVNFGRYFVTQDSAKGPAKLSASQDSTKEPAYGKVIAAVRERAPNYWKNPSGPGLGFACADFRVNELMYCLSAEYSQMYQCRVPGGDIAPVKGKPNVGSATLDMFAGRVKIIIYVGHGDCKWNASVRNRTASQVGTGHFSQAVSAAAEVAQSDMEQGIRHMQSMMTNPTLSARIKSGEVEFVGLFLDADGSVYVWEQKTNKYKLIQAGAAKP